MTLQSSGFIDLSDVQGEHGGSNPILMSEYYLGKGIDQFKQGTVSLSNLVVSSNGGFRSIWGDCMYDPQLNSGGYLYIHKKANDNGSAGTITSTMTVTSSGTYTFNLAHISDSSGGCNYKIYKNGSLIYSTRVVGGGYASVVKKFYYAAGDSLKLSVYWDSPSGWSGSHAYIGGDNWNTRTLTIQGNTGVPTSGTIKMSDFHGTTNY